MELIEVTGQNFEKEVIEYSKTKPVLVDFWAEWCGPCRTLTPQLEKLAEEDSHTKKVKFCKLNVDDAREIAANYGIQSIPTIIIFKNGEKAAQVIGANIESIKKAIADLV